MTSAVGGAQLLQERREYALSLKEVDENEDAGDEDDGHIATTAPLQLISLHPPRRYKGRLFSLRNNEKKDTVQAALASAAGRVYDYEQKYSEDQFGEETFPEARIWRVYNDEAEIFDLEKIEAWRDALDVLLVFLGLFSAIVTAFVVETSSTLQPDYAQLSAVLNWEILHAIANASSSTPISINVADPRSATASPSLQDNRVNTLWFTSLAISLSAGLLTVLVKQWLYHYTSSTSGTSRQRARIRQFRHDGLTRYGVALIIDLLPVALHISLALFLAGLALYLRPLNPTMFKIVAGITGASYSLYFTSILLPLLDAQCPYHSPVTSYLYFLLRYPIAIVSSWVHWTYLRVKHRRRPPPLQRTRPDPPPSYSPPATTLADAEKLAVVRKASQLDVNSIVWLYTASANSTVRRIALEAFGGLEPADIDASGAYQVLDLDLYTAVRQCSDPERAHPFALRNMEGRHDRLLRALSVGGRVKVKEPFDLNGAVVTPVEDTAEQVFGQWIMPWFERMWEDNLTLVALFPPWKGSTAQLPLPIWAAVLRLVKRHHPNHPAITFGIISTLFLPLHAIEMGAVSFEKALQNTFVRSLALEYLKDNTGAGVTVVALVENSLSSLLSAKNTLEMENMITQLGAIPTTHSPPGSSDLLSIMLSSMFKGIAQHDRSFMSDTNARVLRAILHNFFQSPHVDRVSWQTIYQAIQAWDHTPRAVLTTPVTIRRTLEQFRRRADPEDYEEIDWVSKAAHTLPYIVQWCLDPDWPELAEAFCVALVDLDMLPGGLESSEEGMCLRIFWSDRMVDSIVHGTATFKASSKVEQGWFGDWLGYIHAPERLVLLCRWLLSKDHVAELDELCYIQPANAGWPDTLKALFLFQDQDFLDSMTGDFEDPRQHLASLLRQMKGNLQGYHSVLSDPNFDIPEFDQSTFGGGQNIAVVLADDQLSKATTESLSTLMPPSPGPHEFVASSAGTAPPLDLPRTSMEHQYNPHTPDVTSAAEEVGSTTADQALRRFSYSPSSMSLESQAERGEADSIV